MAVSEISAPYAGPEPKEIWASLQAAAAPHSELEGEIVRITGELSAQGIFQSGIAVTAAHDLARDHGFVWEPVLDRFVDIGRAAPQLDADGRDVVTAAGQHFAATGDWPTDKDVVRDLARDGKTKARSAMLSLPGNVGWITDGRLVLTAEGLALSGHGTEVLEALAQFARTASEIYLGEDEQPVISTSMLADTIEQGQLDKLDLLIRTETMFLGSGSNGGDGWVWEVTEGAVIFQGCSTIDEYLVRRRELLPVATPSGALGSVAPAVAPVTSDTVVSLDDLHPTIRDAVADQVIAGCPEKAVHSAALALSEVLRSKTGLTSDGTGLAEAASVKLIYGGDEATRTGRNLNKGTKMMVEGFMLGVRNITGHELHRISPEEASGLIAMSSAMAYRVESATIIEDEADTQGEATET